MAPVDLVEAIETARLTAEELHRRHAGDVLLQEGVDARDPEADGAIRLAHVPAEPLRHDDDERQNRERQQRQAPVHPQQHDHDAEEREDVAEDRDDAGREHVVEHVDVRRDARHQAADRVAIVELDVDALQVTVDLHAHVEHDALPRHLQHPGLQVFERERAEKDAKKSQRDAIEAGQIGTRDVLIDGDFHQVGLRQLQDGVADDRRQRHRCVEPVRP